MTVQDVIQITMQREAQTQKPLEQICKYARYVGPNSRVRAGYVVCDNPEAAVERENIFCCVGTTFHSTGHTSLDASVSKVQMYGCGYRTTN